MRPADCSTDRIALELRERGWTIVESVVDAGLVERLREDLARACETCRRIQVANDITARTEGTAHHILAPNTSLMEFVERLYLHEHIRTFLGGPFILNSFGGVIHSTDGSYVSNIHRDIRTYSGELKLMLNMLVMLDDFTVENGATYLLSGSHRSADRPSEADFYARAIRAVGPRGSIVLFDSNLWHAAGENRRNEPRRALTLTFSRPFMKQQLDYPRYLGYEYGETLREEVKQVLGYNSRIPTNLDEWYQPPEKRLYKPGQG